MTDQALVKKIKFIRDKPADEDLFGGHDRVAEALCHIIKSDQDVRIIGLLGPWGSGKSTAVHLAEGKLAQRDDSDKKKTFLFTFDAWLNQSDPLRRAFIEAFISFLVSKNLTTEEKWKQSLEELSRRSEIHDIETTPRLRGWGAAIAASLLLYPFAIQYSDAWWSKVIVLLPFGFLALNYICWRPTWCFWNPQFWTRSNWTKHKRPHQKKSILSIFVNKSVDRVSNRIIKTPDPTAIEFRQKFKEVMNDVSRPDRRFVFVIDNLDRVSEEDALELWSTVRSFFYDRSDELAGLPPGADYMQPWVILPFDPDALLRLYANRNEATVQHTFNGGGEENKEARERMYAFIEKTFDTVLYVGPPVMSDWQTYLATKLREAFGDLVADPFQAIKIYELTFDSRDQANKVTPRKLNSFINRLAGLALQRWAEVPFSALAYYAAFAHKVATSITQILYEESNSAMVMDRLDPHWRMNVSAIHFGTTPDKALQLLMEGELRGVVEAANEEQFSKLVKVPGFEKVFERLVETSTTSKMETRLLVNCAAFLDDTEFTGSQQEWVWNRLSESTMNLMPWDWSDIGSKGLKALVHRGGNNTRLNLLKSLGSISEDFSSKGSLWFSYLKACLVDLDEDSIEAAAEAISVPGEATFYVEVIAAAAEDEFDQHYPALTGSLRPKADVQKIVEHLAGRCNETGYGHGLADTIRLLYLIEKTWAWEKVVSQTDHFIRSDPPLGCIEGALEVLIRLKENSQEQLQSLCSEGVLTDLLYNSSSKNNISAVVGILLVFAEINPKLNVSAHPGNSAAGLEKLQDINASFSESIDEIAGAMHHLISRTYPATRLEALIETSKKYANWNLIVGAIIKHRLQQTEFGPVNLPHVIKNVGHLLNILDEDGRLRLVECLSGYEVFWPQLQKDQIDTVFARVIDIGLASSKPSVRNGSINVFRGYLQEKTVDWWEQECGNHTTFCEILVKLIEADESIELGEQFTQGLEKFAQKIITEGNPSDNLWDLSFLTRAFSYSARSTFFRNLIDRMRGSDRAEATFVVFKSFGGALLHSDEFQKDSDQNVRRLILPLLSPNGGLYRAVCSFANLLGSIVRQSESTTIEQVEKKISGLLSGDIDEDCTHELMSFATAAGLDIDKLQKSLVAEDELSSASVSE